MFAYKTPKTFLEADKRNHRNCEVSSSDIRVRITGGTKPAEFRDAEIVRSFRFVEVRQKNVPGGANQNGLHDFGGSAASGFGKNTLIHIVSFLNRDSCIGRSFEDGRNRGPVLVDPDTGAIRKVNSINLDKQRNCKSLSRSGLQQRELFRRQRANLQLAVPDLAPSFTVSDAPGGDRNGAAVSGETLRVTWILTTTTPGASIHVTEGACLKQS